jgi:hypothetical protein
MNENSFECPLCKTVVVVKDTEAEDKRATAVMTAYRDALLKTMKQYKGYTEAQYQEYIETAEDLEGPEYWGQFYTWQELATDIREYFLAQGPVVTI